MKKPTKKMMQADVMSARRIPIWAREIIAEVADAHDVLVNGILMDFRNDKACLARREAIYKIKVKKPSLSSPQIGKWFDKNPATILYSLARHSHETGSPALSTYSLEKRLNRPSTGRPVGRPRKGMARLSDMYLNGASIAEMVARIPGITRSDVLQFIADQERAAMDQP